MRAAEAARGSIWCRACGSHYDADEWGSLPLSRRLDPTDLRRIVLNWPERLCIEVRSCARCRALIAVRCKWRETVDVT
jgi:hypothetical protein